MSRKLGLSSAERDIIILLDGGKTIGQAAGIMHMSVQELLDELDLIIRRKNAENLGGLIAWYRESTGQ
jgi:hypothetical protein